MWKYQNSPKDKTYFFLIFSKVKNMFLLYMDHGKIINTPARQLNKFLISGQKKKKKKNYCWASIGYQLP
jgi:hypothetical protein